MNLDVRKVDPSILKVIDEQAIENGMNRSEFVRFLLQESATKYVTRDAVQNYDIALNKAADEMKRLMDEVNKLKKKLDDVTHLVEVKIYSNGVL